MVISFVLLKFLLSLLKEHDLVVADTKIDYVPKHNR